ncbi:MAG: HEAT repeat domain-containing protein [Elusimicrobiota bacterium]|nr:HEAT repeat domain-containing protein [Endomicrobiia bacterium]MDW8165425.1 HEAT repeat domain-containing protein [Elusimicrobiota bacterium]
MLNLKFIKILIFILLCRVLYAEITKEVCEEWISNTLVSSSESSIKIYILENLQDIPSAKFLPGVKKISLLKTTPENVYLKSLYVLYKVYKSTSALEKIANFLLQKPKKESSETPLIKAKIYLKNQLRAEAAKMIGELGDERHLEILSKTVKDEYGIVSDASYFALAMLSKRGKIKPLNELKEFFYSGLKDVDYKVRLKAVRYLGELRYPDSVGPLSLRLKDTSKEVVVETIISLGKVGDVSVLQDLLQFKNSQEDAYRVALAEALGSLAEVLVISSKDTSVMDKIRNVLNSLMNDPNGMVRVTAAAALLRISDRSGIEVIKKGLESIDTDVILYCIKSLGNYGNFQDIKLIEKFTQHNDLLIQTYAYVSILKIYYKERK